MTDQNKIPSKDMDQQISHDDADNREWTPSEMEEATPLPVPEVPDDDEESENGPNGPKR